MTSQLWVGMTLGLSAIAIALLLQRLMREPRVRLHRSVFRIALSVLAALALSPFLAMAAGMAIVIAWPVLLMGPFFLLFWRERPALRGTEVGFRGYAIHGGHAAASAGGAHPA